MRIALFSLAAGLLLLRFLPQLPPPWMLSALLVVGLLLLAVRRWPFALFCLGLCWSCQSAQWAMDDRLPEPMDGRTFWLEGQVIGLPDSRNGVVRFELQNIASRHTGLPSRIRLAWYGGPPMLAGERWRVAAKLKRPRGLVNPHGYDYEAWMLSQRIGASGTVKSGNRLAAAVGEQSWRDRLRQRLVSLDAHGRSGAIAALVVGDSSGLSTADWRTLQDTGTVHLMVISGQHVGMLAGLLYALVALMARRGLWPSRLAWLPCACGLAFAGALAYGWLAGFDVPVRRACIMVGLVLLWRLRFRHLGVWLPLLMAMDLVLVLDPLVSLQSGFWLSFGAVALLAFLFRGRLGNWRWWHTLGRAQWGMAFGLLPAMVALGLPVSLIGPVANLFAVPLVSLLIVPFSLLGTALLWLPGAGEGLLWLTGGLLSVLFEVLQGLAGWQPAWLAARIALWGWLLVALGMLLLLSPSGVPLRALGLVLLLPLFYPPVNKPFKGQADVWVFDVGQGLAVLVRTRDHALLYDAGPRYGEFDVGERVVYPSLRALAVKKLDLMVLSHADIDHAGGAPGINRQMTVRRVLSGERDRLPASLAAETCRSGETWEWDQVRFTLWQWAHPKDGNQASCVLLVEASGERILLTGDIDVAAERALLSSDLAIDAQWLLVPHHGSRSSSSTAFIEAVGPRGALISRSLHNAFGHPHPDVLERLKRADAAIHDTALEGALIIRLGRFEPAEGLRAEARFWREK